MDEKTQSQEKPKAPAEDTSKGVQPEAVNQFDRADAIVKRLQEENNRTEALLKRQEELAARNLLAGVTNAGSVNKAPEELEKEKAEEEVKKIIERFRPPRI